MKIVLIQKLGFPEGCNEIVVHFAELDEKNDCIVFAAKNANTKTCRINGK